MVHFTCVTNRLYRIAEEVREKFNNVDKLISSVKKLFRKAPNCVQLFKDKTPYLNLSPKPIVDPRWSMRINASNHYCENVEIICQILKKLDVDNDVSIKKTKRYVYKISIENYLTYIKYNFNHFHYQALKTRISISQSCKYIWKCRKII